MTSSTNVPPAAVLYESDVRRLLPLDTIIGVTEQALIAHAQGGVTQPAPWHLDIPGLEGVIHGEVHVKGAYLHGASHYAVKLATGFFANADLGLPVSGGLSIVADARTGHPAVLALDNGYLTDARTGAAGALATHALARADADRVAVIGVGVQADYQLRSLLHLRQPGELVVCGRNPARTDDFARRMRERHSWNVTTTDSVERAVGDAAIVITTTPSREPLVYGSWLAPGTHVTAVGSDAPGKQELDIAVIQGADAVVVDDLDQSRRLGELQTSVHAGTIDRLAVDLLGHVLASRRPAIPHDASVTVADLTGLGAEDAAVATQLVSAFGRTLVR